MPILHGLVAHQFKQRADVVKVINRLLKGVERRPLLQGLGKLTTPVLELKELVVDVLNVNLGPRYVVVVVHAVYDVIVELVQTLQQVKLFLDLVQFRLLGMWKSEQIFADGVRRMLSPECVEMILQIFVTKVLKNIL